MSHVFMKGQSFCSDCCCRDCKKRHGRVYIESKTVKDFQILVEKCIDAGRQFQSVTNLGWACCIYTFMFLGSFQPEMKGKRAPCRVIYCRNLSSSSQGCKPSYIIHQPHEAGLLRQGRIFTVKQDQG